MLKVVTRAVTLVWVHLTSRDAAHVENIHKYGTRTHTSAVFSAQELQKISVKGLGTHLTSASSYKS